VCGGASLHHVACLVHHLLSSSSSSSLCPLPASSGFGPVMVPLLGGSGARVFAATLTAPLELIRTQAQARSADGPTLLKSVVDIVRWGGGGGKERVACDCGWGGGGGGGGRGRGIQ
jgi:hypothetical protein